MPKSKPTSKRKAPALQQAGGDRRPVPGSPLTDEDAKKLIKGDRIEHRRYGSALVEEMMMDGNFLFGVVITLATEHGRELLSRDSGMQPGTPFLEDSARNLLHESSENAEPTSPPPRKVAP